VAPESGFKEGEHIRAFPFGYVAHDEASDPDSPVDVSITVGADELIRELRVAWGGGDSVWTYTVTYTDLGTTPRRVNRPGRAGRATRSTGRARGRPGP
jgi:hypothetical protein